MHAELTVLFVGLQCGCDQQKGLSPMLVVVSPSTEGLMRPYDLTTKRARDIAVCGITALCRGNPPLLLPAKQ